MHPSKRWMQTSLQTSSILLFQCLQRTFQSRSLGNRSQGGRFATERDFCKPLLIVVQRGNQTVIGDHRRLRILHVHRRPRQELRHVVVHGTELPLRSSRPRTLSFNPLEFSITLLDVLQHPDLLVESGVLRKDDLLAGLVLLPGYVSLQIRNCESEELRQTWHPGNTIKRRAALRDSVVERALLEVHRHLQALLARKAARRYQLLSIMFDLALEMLDLLGVLRRILETLRISFQATHHVTDEGLERVDRICHHRLRTRAACA